MYQDILEVIAPCGLHCGKCFAFNKGDIASLSQKLRDNLGKFDIYAERFQILLNEPIFSKYPDFINMLDHFAEGSCNGCRNEQCKLFSQCGVRPCSQKKELDYCFQCDDFPCSNTNFDEHLQKRWLSINTKIREIGIKKYYSEIKDKTRY